jgi:hypothetical protein
MDAAATVQQRCALRALTDMLHRRAGAAAWLLAVAFGVFCLGHPSARYTFDGVGFAFALQRFQAGGESAGILFHNHHLLYVLLGHLFGGTLAWLGVELTPWSQLVLLNLVLAVFTLRAAAGLFGALLGGPGPALAATACLGMSYGFWFYALEAEVYVLQTLGFVWALWLSLPPPHGATAARPARWWWPPVMAAGCAVFGVAAHLSSGVAWLPLGWAVWRRAPSRAAGWVALGLFLALAVLGTAVMYAVCWRLAVPGGTPGLLQWTLGSALMTTPQGYAIQIWSVPWRTLPALWDGSLAALAARGPWMLQQDVWTTTLEAVSRVPFALGLLLFARVGWRATAPPVRRWLVLVTLPLLVFGAVLEPWNIEYKVAQLPAWWLWAMLGAVAWARAAVDETRRARRLTLVTAGAVAQALLLGATNHLAAIGPGEDPKRNADLQRALFVARHTPQNALIYFGGSQAGFNTGKIYLLYFAQRQTRPVDYVLHQKPFPNMLLGALVRDAAQGVYVLGELLEPGPALSALASNHNMSVEDIRAVFQAQPLRLVARMEDGFAIYVLDGPVVVPGVAAPSTKPGPSGP